MEEILSRFAPAQKELIAMLHAFQAEYGYIPKEAIARISRFLHVSEGEIFIHTGLTLMRMLVGLAIAFAVAIPFGMLMGTSRTTERMFSPLLSVLMPIPSLAWVPLFVLWFGLGNLATILVVIYASVFTLIFNTWVGVRALLQVSMKYFPLGLTLALCWPAGSVSR